MGVTWGHGDYTQGNSFCKEQLQTNRENFYSSRLEAFTIPGSQVFVTAGTRYCCVRSFFSKTGGFGQFCVPTSPLFGRAVYFLVQISEDKWASDEEDWTSPEDPGLWAGCRDSTGFGVVSLGLLDDAAGEGECVSWVRRRMNSLFGDGKDWWNIDCYIFTNIFPFPPRHPARLNVPVLLAGQ